MSKQRLIIDQSVDDAIRRHGEETYPHECCGALVGTGQRVATIVALPNTTEEGPRRRFLVRPSDYRMAEERAAAAGGDLLGFYHSHPDHPARPSQYDLDHAWPTFAYIIVNVAGAGEPRRPDDVPKAGLMTVWFLEEDRSNFEEGELHYGDEDSDTDAAQAVHR